MAANDQERRGSPEGPEETEKRVERSPAGPGTGQQGGREDFSTPEANAEPGAEYGESAMQCESTQLMFAVQAGDHDAFEELSRSLRGRAFHIARSLVGSREDAIELCQETFMKVFSARATYNPSQPFLPWFHRILRNTCFSFLRKNRRVKKQSLSALGADGEELDWEIVDPSPGPEAGIEAEEEKRVFQTALEQLSARDREILALRHFKELSYREIAQSIGIPEGTVMSRLFHARRRLKKALGPLLRDHMPDVAEHENDKGAR